MLTKQAVLLSFSEEYLNVLIWTKTCSRYWLKTLSYLQSKKMVILKLNESKLNQTNIVRTFSAHRITWLSVNETHCLHTAPEDAQLQMWDFREMTHCFSSLSSRLDSSLFPVGFYSWTFSSLFFPLHSHSQTHTRTCSSGQQDCWINTLSPRCSAAIHNTLAACVFFLGEHESSSICNTHTHRNTCTYTHT